MIKWLGAFIGFEFGRFGGAVIGFIIGSIIDMYIRRSRGQASGGGYSPFGGQSAFYTSQGDFELNLLSLSSMVIKADGAVSQKELDYVRAYFVRMYGKERANAAFRTFNEVIKNRQVNTHEVCAQMRMRTSYEMRLQILHFLFGVAMADGKIGTAELSVLQNIAGYLNINSYDFESISAMFQTSGTGEEAYKILEVEKEASDAEIKKAYRKMVKKYHPDRLTGMDEAYIKGAKEKFNKVQEAYEQIRKERGF